MIFLKSNDCPTANLQAKENLENKWSIKTFFRRILILTNGLLLWEILKKSKSSNH